MKIRPIFRVRTFLKTLIFIILCLAIIALIILYKNNWFNFISLNSKIITPLYQNDKHTQIMNLLNFLPLSVIYVNYIDNTTVEASLSSGVKVIFSLENDIFKQAASLQLILSRFRIEGRKINRIDLRFKNPVIE